MGIILKNGTIWTGSSWFNGDILIEKNLIVEISENLTIDNNHLFFDLKGKVVAPGFIDLHVHLREPGFPEKETIATGILAAVKGGFTTIAAMPNTKPVLDNLEVLNFVREKSKKINKVRLLPIASITKGEEGNELTDFATLQQNGIFALSDDGKGVQNSRLMYLAMVKAKELNLPILAHTEDENLANKGVVHLGKVSSRFNLLGIPSEAETVQIARDLLLAEKTKVHYHVCHISTKEGVRLLREAKKLGINVTAEVTPHHLLLNEEDILKLDSNYKMNPPLRSKEDQAALLKGILDGTIDIIATDHAPHTVEEKNQSFITAPFGIVGLEIAFPLLYTYLVLTKKITLELLLKLLSTNSAKAFNLPLGVIEVGKRADLVVLDLTKKEVVNKNKFLSKGKNTPFNGRELTGWPILTIYDGKIVYSDIET